MSQEPLVDEQKLTLADGTTRWTSHRISPLAGGVAITSKETTGTKQLEMDLRNALQHRQRYAAELEEKNKQLLAMSAPIIQAWEGVLALPVIGVLDGARVQQIMEKLLADIVRTGARFAIVDLTGVDAADASTVDHLLRIVRAANLIGSRCLVSGISPAVAQAMVETGASHEGFMTFGLLQDALRHALLSSGALRRHGAVSLELPSALFRPYRGAYPVRASGPYLAMSVRTSSSRTRMAMPRKR